MKSPLKPNWIPLKKFAGIGIPFSVLISIVLHYIFPDTFGWEITVFSMLFYSCFFVLMGYSLSKVVSSINMFHRVVVNPVKISNLTINTVYWLNGETWARYIGQDDNTGQYGFSIYGIGDYDNPIDAVFMAPHTIKRYISTIKEVF